MTYATNAFGIDRQTSGTIESAMVDHICKLYFAYGQFVVGMKMHRENDGYMSLLLACNEAVAWLSKQTVPDGFLNYGLKRATVNMHNILQELPNTSTVDDCETSEPYHALTTDENASLVAWREELDEAEQAEDVELLERIKVAYYSLGVFIEQSFHAHHEDKCNAIGWDHCEHGCFHAGVRIDGCSSPHACNDMSGLLYGCIHNAYGALEAGVEDDELRTVLTEAVWKGLSELLQKYSVDALSAVDGINFDIHRRMANHPNFNVRRRSALHEKCPDEVLLALAKDEEYWVLEAVYEAVRTRSSEPDHDVLSTIAGSNDTSLSLLIQFGKDESRWENEGPYRERLRGLAQENIKRRVYRTMEAEDPDTAFHGVTMMVHKVMNEPDFEEMFGGLKVKEKAMARKKNASFTDVQLAEMFPGGLDEDLKAFTEGNPHFPLGILSAWVKRDDPDQRLRWFPMLAFYLVAVVSRTRYWNFTFTFVDYYEGDTKKYAHYAK